MENQAIRIVKKLKKSGFQALFAGGCVRDKLMGNELHDYDIATNATPQDVEDLFEKTIPVGKAFGVTIAVVDDIEFEIATFRNDGIYFDGRRPDSVSFSTMEEDAQRRDLTINGMFFDPIEDKIFDFVRGQEDIKNKIIRLIGNPEDRIEEDKLRMMRVIRFATRFDFEIEKNTFEAVKKHSAEIEQVSFERISEEFIKTLRLKNKRKSLELLFDTNLIDVILPEVKALKGVEQPKEYHPEGDCERHTILALENLPGDASDELLMGTLLHDIGKPLRFKIAERIRFDGHDVKGAKMTEEILNRMKFSNEFIERVVALVANHMKFMCVKDMRVSRLKRFIRQDNFEENLALHRADCLSSHGSLENIEFIDGLDFPPEKIHPPKLITGKDLIEIGFKPGPLFKTILTDIEDRQLENVLTSKEEALDFVKENF